MNRIVIAAVAVVLSNFAIACAGGSIVDDAAVQDIQQNENANEVLLAPPTQDKMGNAVAPELPPTGDKLGVKDRGNSWNDKSKDPLLGKSVHAATTIPAITVPNVRGELKNETMNLPGVDVPNVKGEMPAGARDLPVTRLPNTRGEIPAGATNIPSFELPNIHNDLPQEGMDIEPYDVQGVRVQDSHHRNYMK